MYNEREKYDKWVQSRSPADLVAILTELNPIIRKEVNKWKLGIVSVEALTIKAKQLAIQGIESFDVNGGTKLSSWVSFYLKKLGRYVNSYNIISVSEDKQLDYNKYLAKKQNLIDEFDAPPTLDDMADAMSWSPSKVLNIEKQFNNTYNDSTLNTAKYLAVSKPTENDLRYAYENLEPMEQRLFTMKTGWPTGKAIKLSDIANRMGMSTGKISKDLKNIADKVNRLMQR